MTEYRKLKNEEKVIGNDQVGWHLELEGVCRGVIVIYASDLQFEHTNYSGILQRAKGEMVPFQGKEQSGGSPRLDAMIAKTSSETGQAVKMWCHYSSVEVKKGIFKKDTVKGLWLIVDELMLGNLKA